MAWDIFCRVIDNFGDAGVCWRLAAGLATAGHAVRLWIDDAAPLQWMASQGARGVAVGAWNDAEAAEPGDVVIEAFGCDPPARFIERMARRARAPVWINFEYLSAEPYVERSHGLSSPQFAGPGAGLTKWFYYPGFSTGTGGLLRGATPAVSRRDWLQSRGWAPHAGERVVLLFCYQNAALPQLLDALSEQSTLLLAAPGLAEQAVRALGPQLARLPSLRCIALPWLPQPEFDRLLHCTDLNFVRGEDSFVQAQWPGIPFVWQIYPQADGAHGPKLDAFLDRFASQTSAVETAELRPLWLAWNGLAPWPSTLPRFDSWQQACSLWRDHLLGQQDLITQLSRFVSERR